MNEIKLKEKPLRKHWITQKIKISKKKKSNKLTLLMKCSKKLGIIKFH